MAEELPPPPAIGELRKLGPEIHVLPGGTLLWRVYFRAGPYPSTWNAFRHFGPTDARFDHHDPPPAVHAGRAILHGADAGPTCLAEVFQTTRVIDRRHRIPHLAAFELDAPLSLLDVTGAWVTRAGGNMAISSGSRVRSREWSRAIYDAYPKLQGIRYASSMNANQCRGSLRASPNRSSGGSWSRPPSRSPWPRDAHLPRCAACRLSRHLRTRGSERSTLLLSRPPAPARGTLRARSC